MPRSTWCAAAPPAAYCCGSAGPERNRSQRRSHEALTMSSDNCVQSNGVVGKTQRFAARGIRLAQLVAARFGATAADAMRRKAKELEIRLDGLHKGLAVKPISDIAFPKID